MITQLNNAWQIDTPNTTYIVKLMPTGHLQNVFYGARLNGKVDVEALVEKQGTGAGCSVSLPTNEGPVFPDDTCFEYSTTGRGDYREPMLAFHRPNGDYIGDFRFVSAETTENFVVPDLPNTDGKSSTLQFTLQDEANKLTLKLYYSVFEDSDVIVRSASLTNDGNENVFVDRFFSLQIDFPDCDYDVVTLDGSWAKERYQNVRQATCGVFYVDSKRGMSSSGHNPYVVLKKRDCSDRFGDAYGFNLVYSGNHKETVEVSPLGKTRVMTGISDFEFCWTLGAGETFFTPEATTCFSSCGTGGLTSSYHRFVNDHVVPKYWRYRERPVLVNNWEATYFDFTEFKLLDLARKAKNLGAELFVLDDGWFGSRTSDKSGLGDWVENPARLSEGLKGLAYEVNEIGLDFGVWVEPEMVNPDSNLYRKHPDWAIAVPNLDPMLSRNQLVLDLTRSDVQDYLIESMTRVFSSANVAYVKWDCNRNITDCHSATLQNQGEFFHRYELGLYRVLDALTKAFPQILFESCASGGNRFDLGMLCYMPQTWASDNTDSFDRVKIVEGTLTAYPQSTIGSHVSTSPNHQTLRVSTIENRFNTAALGLLGYELDLSELSAEENRIVKNQIKWYKEHRKTLQFGDYYRLKSVFSDRQASWLVVSSDKKHAVANVTNKISETIPPQETLRTRGLDDDKTYLFRTKVQRQRVRIFGGLIKSMLPKFVRNDRILHRIIDGVYKMKTDDQHYEVSGSLLNNCGVRLNRQWGSTGLNDNVRVMGDFGSRIYTIDETEETN